MAVGIRARVEHRGHEGVAVELAAKGQPLAGGPCVPDSPHGQHELADGIAGMGTHDGRAENPVAAARGYQPDEAAGLAIGDGANDLDMMAAAGISIAYHAKPVVQEKATYSINHVGLNGVINLFNE